MSYVEKHRFGHGVAFSKVCYGILECVFFPFFHVDYRNVSGLSFSNSGLEAWLPAFQMPMFAKCDALPKGVFFDMFV